MFYANTAFENSNQRLTCFKAHKITKKKPPTLTDSKLPAEKE